MPPPSLESLDDEEEMELLPVHWTPPDFGVTVLGSGHGFDACGGTSGYIIWVQGRGIMVDPPPFSQSANIIISSCQYWF